LIPGWNGGTRNSINEQEIKDRSSPPKRYTKGIYIITTPRIQNYRNFTTLRLTPKRYRIYKNKNSLSSQTKLI
jgi:cobyric acid synthase